MKTGPDYFLAHYSTSVDSQETKLNRGASTGPIFDLKSAVSILGGVTLTKCFSNPSAPLNTATCSDILNTDGWWAAFPHSSSEKGLRNATANSRWESGKCFLSGRQNTHYSVWRGGGGFQQDPRQQMYETADGAGQMVPLRRHRVPLWLGTPTPLYWCSFHLNFRFPFQLRHSSYPSQGTPSVPEGYFIFSRSPKDPGTRACLYSDFFGQQYGEGVVLTSVNPQEERLAHFSEHPRVVCSSITAGLKHVGGGEQEIGFHTTGLGWTFQ